MRKSTGAVAEVGDRVKIRDPGYPEYYVLPWRKFVGQTGQVERITYGKVLTQNPRHPHSPPRKYWVQIGDELQGPWPSPAIEKLS